MVRETWLNQILRYRRSLETKKGSDFTLSLQQLLTLWDHQNGRCAVSRLPLACSLKDPRSAALVRINPSRPYEQGNVRLVASWVAVAEGRYQGQIAEVFRQSDYELRKSLLEGLNRKGLLKLPARSSQETDGAVGILPE